MRKIFFALAVVLTMATSCNQPCQQCSAPESDQNQVIETIMSRRSIRAYKDTPVPRELLQQVAECGIQAPNGMNAQ